MNKPIQTDILVIGSGLAGEMAAISPADEVRPGHTLPHGRCRITEIVNQSHYI